MRNHLATGLLLIGLVGCASAPRPSLPTHTAPDLRADLEQLADMMERDLDRTESASSHGRAESDVDALLSVEIPSHVSVEKAVRYFSTGLKNSIQTSLTRSARYKLLIDRILDEHGVPRAFAYLPVIESGYATTLTSRAGARGMWQFMPATAREYGLRVDWWVDERNDVEKSTRAAARYLRDLHRMFNDWPLVLAAYNAGPGRVRRTLADERASTFWELLDKSALPKETRGYVPTFFATVSIAGDPERFGFKLQPAIADTDRNWDEVELAGPLSMEFLAEITGSSESDLRERNASFHRGIIPPGVQRVKVPAQSVAALRPRARTLHEEDAIVPVATHKLSDPRSLEQLCRSINVPVDEVLSMNGTRADRLAAGQTLYLPVRQTQLSDLLTHRETVRASTYTVARGDTLYSIARRHSLTVEQVREINGLDEQSVLQPGQELIVAAGSTSTAGGGR